MAVTQPKIEGPEAYLAAIRNSGAALRQTFDGKPEALAERLQLVLPRKPVQIMKELGIYDPERHGPDTPGLRDLVIDVCNLSVKSAAVVGPRGGGKMLCLNTPVPTSAGWKTMGTLELGDILYDREGNPCRVVKLYPVYTNKRCYAMTFSDGSEIVSSGTHPWITQTTLERAANGMHAKRILREDGWHGQWGGLREAKRTTNEIRKTLRVGNRGDANHSIDNTKPLKFPKADLLVDPYFLGVWLGDGTINGGTLSINSSHLDIAKEIERRGIETGAKTKVTGKNCYRVGALGMLPALRELGVLSNKHVPDIYLRGSIGQRRALLAGLMDTDGTVRNNNNNCQFDNMNEQISDAVYELVVSLGWKATRYKKAARLNGIDYGTSHGVLFRPTRQIFKCAAKSDLLNFDVAQETRHLRRMITDVQRVPSVPVRCIEVDSPSHTYLVGNQMVPTHNSQGVSFIEFYLVFIKMFDALNLGGSELQADQVYRYLVEYIESDPYWQELVKGAPMRERTDTHDGAWIRVLAASQKSVRSPHAGGRKKGGRMAGGILVIDEEAEADEGIVDAALPTINTAKPSVNVRSSTFHNAEGSFAELIENHDEMGYKLYQWDVFDICEPCACVDVCQSKEPCFREDHFETYDDPDTGKQVERLVHRAYCGGRSMYASGWMPQEEIETLWRRSKRNHAKWEVEAMGSRPVMGGHTVKSRKHFDASIVEVTGRELYLPGAPTDICVDWGTKAAAIEVWQHQPNDYIALIEAELVEEAGPAEMIGKIVAYWHRYVDTVREVRADIGGGGNYMNKKLIEDHHLTVVDVAFSEEKEAAVAALNVYNDNGKLRIPREHEEFIRQMRKWRRKNGRIVKGDDHLCDGAVCYFSRFINELGLQHIRIGPRTVNTGPQQPGVTGGVSGTSTTIRKPGTSPRVAVVRSFGSRRG